MPSGLTVFGTDGSKHETTVKEESLGTFVQGISQNEMIQVKPSGISGGASINWTLAYASGYGSNAALSPVTNISPLSGTLDVNHLRDDVTLTFNTSSLAVQTYHGELIASGGAGVSAGPYFFTFTVSAGTNPVITPPANQTATEGASTSFGLGSFTDPDGSPWTVDVNWGDGTAHTIFTTSSAGSLGSQSHTYAEEGNYTPTITVTDSSSRSDSKTFKVTVGDAALTSTGGFTVSATEGIVSASQTVATFNDANPTAPLSDFTAMINWGDGTVATAGTITQPGGVGTAFVVKGSHTYAEESASRTITVSITDVGGSTASASSTAVVADAALTATGGFTVTGTESSDTGSQTVAAFTDANPAAPVSDFTATINWGDGNTSAGAITQPGGLGTAFVVKGSHTYAEEGTSYTVTVNVTDVGGSTASALSTGTIGDAALTATGGFTFNATEGIASASQTVATFTDANPAAPLSDFTATIDWGDGNTSAGAISQPGGLGTAFVVKGSHTYTEEGASYTITVNITDVGGSTASTMSTGTVGDAALTATGGFTVTGTEGSDFGSQTVATFTDANPAAPLSDFTAMIDWGDGNTSAGAISQPGGVGTAFVIKGSHTYAEEGASYTVTVDISDVGGSAASATSTASIADAALTASRTPVNAIEGLSFTGPVATFTDANPFAPLGDFTTTIDWGDGNSSAGTVTQPGGPGTDFVVTGTHTYAEEGSFNVAVAITDAGGSTAPATTTASVADAALTATGGFVVTATATGSHTVATFTDANPAAPLSDFTATINWGDGSAPTAGTLSQPGGAGTAFVIQGNHTYPAGSYSFPITVNITDVDGSTTSATSTASASFVVSGYPSPITAGTTNSFTVTAKDVNGNTATGYTGTVKFSSSAPKVILPVNYTFTAGHAGVHNFSATLRSAGSQSITVTDTIIGTFSGTQSGITVNPTVPHHFSISRFPSSTTAGASFTFRVTVQDYYSNTVNTVPGYTDTVSFGSSDIQADLPANYTFKTADAGIHEFTGVLKTAGSQNLTIQDVTNPSIIPGVSLAMMVNPAAMSQLKVSAFPPFVTAGTAYPFTVTAQDPFGNTIPTYRGTVTFTSPTDGAAMLPADYTFTSGDAGQHSNFMATLNTLGLQSITATDTVNSGFTGTESNIKVQSIQPTATVTAPDLGVPGQPLTFVPGEPLTFTFGASQPGLPPDAVFTFNVSWGDGNSQSFTGTSSTTMDHTYLATGTFKINATATYPSTNGNTSLTVSLSVPITAVAMQKDPYNTSLTALYVGGTSGDDNIAITPATVSGGVKVGMNSAILGSFFPTGHVIVYGLAGNDIIKTAAQTIGGVLTYVNVPAIFFGGDGNDTLNVSGSGNMVVSGKMAGNVLVGGAGTDSLIGGLGRDILIGGLGADTVRAGSGGDILIGGTTSYDDNAVALASVLDEWRRTDIDYLTRVGQINGSMSGGINAPYYLNAGTVQADGAVNNLYGGAGMDWYFKGIMDVLTNVS